MKLREWLLDLLFPPKCPFCGKVQDRPGICPDCRRDLPRTEDPEQERLLPGPLRCVSPLWYEGLARDGLLRFKFRGAVEAAEALGELTAQCAAERYPGEFDAVTWAPVSGKRLRERGYDQARLLAEAMCRRWDTVPTAMLRKAADNPAQSGLADAARRRANVLGVYQAEEDAVRGRRILLVDDIVTTGATLCECARVLREAGAESVVCAAAARARPPGAKAGGGVRDAAAQNPDIL